MKKRSLSSRRHSRRKTGSIMIMVVALLVLMALIGTAYIATARYDRAGAQQNENNVQIDLLVQSVLNMCKTTVVGSAFDGNGNFRQNPRNPNSAISAADFTGMNKKLADAYFYYNVTSTGYDRYVDPISNVVKFNERFNCWLADRTPEFGSTSANPANHYFWGRISLPLNTETDATGPARGYFDDPTYVPKPGPVNPTNPLQLRFRFDTELEPTSIAVNGVQMPAFFIDTGLPGLPNPYRALAADADGDGIADSFLVRMPIGEINGLTYYYAVRIVDNAAAVNLNTAFGDQAPMANGNDGWGRRLFPSSVNLDAMFGPEEIVAIHAYRTHRNLPAGATTIPPGPPVNLTRPLPDGAKILTDFRTDFTFLNEHDAFWHQYGRRPENPGYIPSSTNMWHYRGFPLSDLISVVPHFVLAPQSASSVIETTFANNLSNPSNSLGGPPMQGGGTRYKPYSPDDVDPTKPFSWGNQNFNYSGAGTYSRRPLVVMSNAVSNAVSIRYMHGEDVNEDGDLDPGEDANMNASSTSNKPEPPRDLNGDGLVNDVASLDMLDFVVTEDPNNSSSHLRKRYRVGDPWDNGTYQVGDYVQFDYGNGVLLNFIYARTDVATVPTPNPTQPSSTTPNDFAGNFWEYIPTLPATTTNPTTPVKTCINTAGFRELYRTFWQVMAGPTSNSTPYGVEQGADDPYTLPDHIQHQFRSSLRDVHKPFTPDQTYRFKPFQQLLLRAALAAVNTIDLRDSDDDVTSRTIALRAVGRDGKLHPVEVTVFGSEPQPFITEVYANANTITDGTGDPNGLKNEKGYVAVELFNPYDHPIDMTGWQLGLIDRTRARGQAGHGGKDDQLIIRPLYKFPTGASPAPSWPDNIILPGEHFVLENYRDGQNDLGSPTFAAKYRPSQVKVPAGTFRRKYIPDLRKVFQDDSATPKEDGGELVLLRPRRVVRPPTGNPELRSDRPYDLFDENNIYDLVPVDQFDFTGLVIKGVSASKPQAEVQAWHYVRANEQNGDKRWTCVYSGRYLGDRGDEEPRHEATNVRKMLLPPDRTKNEIFNDSVPGPLAQIGNDDPISTFPPATANFPPIQLTNKDLAGPNELQKTNNVYPFGGFMRVGDIMQVPFMGAYRVREVDVDGRLLHAGKFDPLPLPNGAGYKLTNPDQILLELNSLPIDAAFADDGIDGDIPPNSGIKQNAFENIGRFCPLLEWKTKYTPPTMTDPTDWQTNRKLYNDYWLGHSYDFAHRIFDYFTVIAPHEDFFPNVNPDPMPDPTRDYAGSYRYFDTGSKKYDHIFGTSVQNFKPALEDQFADPVKNIDTGSSSASTENNIGVHGLININTANWKVLSTIPWTDTIAGNEEVAKAIVQQRDLGYPALTPPIPAAPFHSLFDLLNVRDPAKPATDYIFQKYQPADPYDPDDGDGDFSPFGTNKDGVTNKYEFEKQYLLINRVSNLLTTRSDSFTAYVVVQGWRNANTANPELVVQRRAAMLIDRSAVTKDNREPRTMWIPVE